MNIAAIIQARTGSTRFPNKVFATLSGKPLIAHIFERISYSKKINQFVLATTTNANDDALEAWAKQNDISCFRGSEDDVLNRYYEAAKFCKADIVVRITADDPFKDYEVIDEVIELLLNNQLDFAYNNNPPSFPEGLDTEVFTFKALQQANENAQSSFEREHVTQYFYKNPTLFKCQNLSYKENISYLRWTLDTETDYEMVQQVYQHLYNEKQVFLMKDILSLLEKYPAIATINQNVKRSAMYN